MSSQISINLINGLPKRKENPRFHQQHRTMLHIKQLLEHQESRPHFLSSLISGVFVAWSMAPFDLVATRFYNQGIDAKGKGLLYRSIVDCTAKIYREEGLYGFYKGWTANYFRLGPHTLLLLVFWDRLKYYHKLREEKVT